MPVHRFAADIMLGRLATWLRLLGQDVVYGPHLHGRALLRAARLESRTVLTRDTHLARRCDVPLLFITSNDFRAQLRQVVAAYTIDPEAALLTRCSECNGLLEGISRAEAGPRVPPYVAQTAERFVRCPRCRRIYWKGTHYDHIRDELAGIVSGGTSE